MSVLPNDTAFPLAISIAVKASLLLAAAALLERLTRSRTSAALRHLGWTLAVVALLALPLLAAVVPAWNVAVHVSAPPAVPADDWTPVSGAAPPSSLEGFAGSPALESFANSAARSVPWPALAIALYLAGVCALLVGLAAQRWTVKRIAHRAVAVDDPHWCALLNECARALGVDRSVRLLRSRDRTMPMTFGTLSPAILLPAIADTWTEDRRRAVLLHELAHVGRHDCLTQMLAAVASSLYWVHPGVPWIARRLRIERELACDDRVLAAGTGARDYAGHLLELAHTLGAGRAPALVVSMARPRQLEGRMLAVMDAARNRAVPGVRSQLTGLAIVAALIVPLASIQITASADDGAALALPLPLASTAAPSETTAVTAPLPADVAAPRSAAPASRSAAAAPPAAQARGRGTWEIRAGSVAGTLHIRLTEGDSSSGSTIAVDRLEGLSTAQLSGAGGPVKFSIRRDAGTFTFDGIARDGVAAGTFEFAANPAFAAELQKRGLERPTADEQYSLARDDVGFAYLDELTKQGYARPTVAQLVRAGQHGVRLDYLREMGGTGYRLGSLEPLITLRDHGVTPEFVRQLEAAGFKSLTADELRRTRDHGVTPEFVRELRELGYTSVTLDEIVNARDHGVDTQFVKDLAAMGHARLPLDQVIRLRDHGVSSEYARGLRDLGQTLTVEQLVTARDHGVSVPFVSELASLGYPKLPIDTLIRIRDHGVTADYVKEIKALGYPRLEIDELVGLRDHGVTPDKIRRANERAGTTLPLDMIKALANGGMK